MKNLFTKMSLFALLCALVLMVGNTAQAKSFDPNSSQYKAAKSALLSASVIVLGAPYTDAEMSQRMVELVGAPYNMEAKYDEGLQFSDAVAFARQRMQKVSFDRYAAVHNAYLETMGRMPTDNERSYWANRILNENKWWYATMIPVFNDYLNNTPDERKATINRVYLAVYGRPAKSVDTNYWMPRKENYRFMREANRQYLWTAGDKVELNAMLTLVYQKLSGKTGPIDEKSYNFLLFLYEKKKSIFEEIKKDYPKTQW